MENTLSQNFINYIKHQPVTIFLTNGVKLTGNIHLADKETVVLSRDGVSQLVYISAIATILPQDAFRLADMLMGEDE